MYILMDHFDWQYYLDKYPDLRTNGIHTEQQAIEHWNNFGKNEGRVSIQSPNLFDWKFYLDKYPDLRVNSIHTEQQAIEHWINYGKNEGRVSIRTTNKDAITAVLNIFKRPHTLIQQLRAIQNQSIQPENIIIWKNYVEGVIMPDIPEDLKKNVIIIESSKNFGVWARFTCGLLVNSSYICVFDDDTIPGKDWFKNCVQTMQTHCGLLGTIGLRFLKGDTYYNFEPRIGWDGPNNNIEQVDIVGHAWFLKQEWLHFLWECKPDYNSMFCVGEDIGFSYILQKYGINTYVPPHPVDNKDLWGSQKELAILYGCENVATCLQPGTSNAFDKALKYFINLGFVTINNKQ